MTRHLPVDTYKKAPGEWDAIIQDLRTRHITVYQDPVTELVIIECDEHQLNELWSITRDKVLALPGLPDFSL